MPKIPVKVRFDTSGLEDALKHYEKNAQSFPISIVGDTIATAMDNLIDAGGRIRWEPFRPLTLELHPRRAGGQLLRDKGELASFQMDEGPDWVEVLSPAPYGVFHQQGTSKVRGWVHSDRGMTARDFTDIDMGSALGEAINLITAEITER
jgi:phage gpG-like protein